jgi:transposase-like protein
VRRDPGAQVLRARESGPETQVLRWVVELRNERNPRKREREKKRATERGRELSMERRRRRGEIILQQIDLLLRKK